MAKHPNFNDDLGRLSAAIESAQLSLAVAREMFGKSYFSLGVGEKEAVDRWVFSTISGNYQAITPEFLASQKDEQPMGFVSPKTAQ